MMSPSSSGRGEAIMTAPSAGTIHQKGLCAIVLPRRVIHGCEAERTIYVASGERTKRNIKRSPHTAPAAPTSASFHAGMYSESSATATIAGVVVSTEVKNVPTIKLTSVAKSAANGASPVITSVLIKTTETTSPNTTSHASCVTLRGTACG